MLPVDTAPNSTYLSEASFDIRSPLRYATITYEVMETISSAR